MPEGPAPPWPRTDSVGPVYNRLEPSGLLKPRQKCMAGLTGRGGADRSARMHAWLRV